MAGQLTFDLVVATVDRVEPLARLLASLERQSHRAFRVLLVDQNEDDRLDDGARGRTGSSIVVRLRSPRGLSRARNDALPHLEADVVAFPDDDCEYPDDLLERVAAGSRGLDGLDVLSGRRPRPLLAVAGRGRRGRSTRDNVWNRGISAAIFLRRDLVERVGRVRRAARARRAGRRGRPARRSTSSIRAAHARRAAFATTRRSSSATRRRTSTRRAPAVGFRDGASVGYLLRKHRYGPRTVARMLVRPAGGALLARPAATAPARASTRRRSAAAVEGYLRAPS